MTPASFHTTEAHQQLLHRILASREFAHAHNLKRVLRYLHDRSLQTGGTPPKEYEIAVQAMGRPETFDPRTDPIVRVSIGSIRDRLLAYFATEGTHERLRLHIPKGQYLPVFTTAEDTSPSEPEKSVKALCRFWQPYLSTRAANVIVYTEPLFFRDDRGHYFRDWQINDIGSGPGQLKSRLPIGDVELHPSFHYLSAGEVHCLLSLSRMCYEMRVPVETRNSRTSSWNELRNANLILLGSPRTNTFLSTLQGDQDFIIGGECIEVREPRGGEPGSYTGRRYLDGKLRRMTEYAVISRRPGLTPGTAVTMIAANHGRAIEGAGHLLTLEDRVESVLESMGAPESGDLPADFQLLMQVETIDIDDEVAEVRAIASRWRSGKATPS